MNTPPAIWEIEWKLVDIVCKQLWRDRSKAHQTSRLLEDLDIDSLEADRL